MGSLCSADSEVHRWRTHSRSDFEDGGWLIPEDAEKPGLPAKEEVENTPLLKRLHYLLTYGTYADRKQYFGSGTFRTKPPRLYKDTAADPREIARKLNKLVMDYEKKSADLEKILSTITKEQEKLFSRYSDCLR